MRSSNSIRVRVIQEILLYFKSIVKPNKSKSNMWLYIEKNEQERTLCLYDLI